MSLFKGHFPNGGSDVRRRVRRGLTPDCSAVTAQIPALDDFCLTKCENIFRSLAGDVTQTFHAGILWFGRLEQWKLGGTDALCCSLTTLRLTAQASVEWPRTSRSGCTDEHAGGGAI